MPLVPNTAVVPPGGFHFVDRSSGVEIRFEGTSDQDVATQVLTFRTRNNLPPGNPLQEYRDYVCGTWPHVCTNSDPAPLAPTIPNGREHISKRVAAWMANFIRNFRAGDLVSPAEAERRAAVCAACPRNVPWNATGCGACIESVSRLAFVYKANRQTPYDRELRACDETGQHNETAIWAKALPPLTPGASLPTQCWRRKESNA